jgi:hypothetical protein
MRKLWLVLCSVFLLTSAGLAQMKTTSAPPMPAELQRVRAALEKYQDPVAAIRDGYFSTVACINFPHESLPGHMHYPKGAMGVHFINPQLIGPVLDPTKPQILLYEPDAGGKLRGVACSAGNRKGAAQALQPRVRGTDGRP